MRKIANTAELETELRRLLVYAQSKLPSREIAARRLYALSQRVAAKKRFTCVSGGSNVTERTADTAEQAAEACAKAIHSAYYIGDKSTTGQDKHGAFEEFKVMSGSRAHSSVRVYENYQ